MLWGLGLLIATSIASSGSSLQQRYMGFYASEFAETWAKGGSRAAGLASTGGWMNLLISDNSSFLAAAKHGHPKLVALLDTKWVLFASAHAANRKWMVSLPQPELAQRLAPIAAAVRQGELDGIFLGDEVVAPFSNISAVARAARVALGKRALLYSNEGADVFTAGRKGSDIPALCRDVLRKGCPDNDCWWSTVPPEMDLVGFDMYGHPSTEVAKARQYAETCVYPQLSSTQRLIAVPGTFAPNVSSDALRQADALVAAKIDDYAQWLGEDQRLAGLNPWHYDDRHMELSEVNFSIGAKNLPLTMDKLRKLGSRLIQPPSQQQVTAVKNTYLSGIRLKTDEAGTVRRNVLFIIVDNYRPAMGAYGDKEAVTPRMDALAKTSTLFSRAYCQEAWCSPSRNSFLSGRTPDVTKVWNFRDSFRLAATGEAGAGANWTTLPGYFVDAGFYTTAAGKVFHDCCGTGSPSHFDFPRSWSDIPVLQTKFGCSSMTEGFTMSCPFNRSAGDADADSETAELIMARLKTWASNSSTARRPFFAAAGLQGTRLPWSYPAHIPAEHYPTGSAKLSVAKQQTAPRGKAGALEWFRPVGVDYMHGINVSHSSPMPVAQQRRQRLAFLAAVTHIDDQVGRLLDTLLSLGVDNDTAVVLTADHGQSLGEGNMWEMMNLLEQSLRVPLLIRPAPNDRRLRNTVGVYSHVVELLDLFPTFASLAGLPPPPASWKLPGTDLTPGMLSYKVVRPLNAAYGQVTRCVNCSMAYSFSSGLTACARDRAEDAALYLTPCAETPRQKFDWMGFSVRVTDWRYSLFCRWNGTEQQPNCHECAPPELYNHSADQSLYDVDENGEQENLAGRVGLEQQERKMKALLMQRFHSETIRVKSDDAREARGTRFILYKPSVSVSRWLALPTTTGLAVTLRLASHPTLCAIAGNESLGQQLQIRSKIQARAEQAVSNTWFQPGGGQRKWQSHRAMHRREGAI